jgi:hypothetical protein
MIYSGIKVIEAWIIASGHKTKAAAAVVVRLGGLSTITTSVAFGVRLEFLPRPKCQDETFVPNMVT